MAQPTYDELLQENQRLRAQVAALQAENARLKAENARLGEELALLRQELEDLREQLADDEDDPDPPSFVKPRRQKEDPQKPGRKPGHRGETRAVPEQVDEERELTLEICPDCRTPLGEPTEVRERYVEDLLPPRRYVIRYRIARYHCPHCRRLVEPKPQDVLPGHHLSWRAQSWIAYLREELRLPVNRVQRFLAAAGLELSSGTIEQVCAKAAEHLQPFYREIQEAARTRPRVGLDETGLRINGANRWMWGLATPWEVVYHPDKRRSHEVAQELLGSEFEGVVNCDFYSAYNPLKVRKQRCWAHLLRDTAELTSEEGQELHRELKELRTWLEAKLGRAPPPGKRARLAGYGEWEIEQLIAREWSDPECRRLVERLRRHKDELFLWVRYPGVEATNNGTERALRPYVVRRKISGGHRSWTGARKHAILLSVLETCHRRSEAFLTTVERALRQTLPSTG